MSGKTILAALLAILIVPLFPVVFIWYVNVSGLYRVTRDARQRQKRRADMLKEMQAARGRALVGVTVREER
jgi:hypothetical protein